MIRQGQEGRALFFLTRGACRIEKEDGTIITTLHAPNFFGEMSLLSQQPAIASVRAASFCDMQKLTREIFEEVNGTPCVKV